MHTQQEMEHDSSHRRPDARADATVADDILAKKDGESWVEPTSWLGREKKRFEQEIEDYRSKAIAAVPATVVNRSTNIIGMLQIVGDMLMFKSGSGAKLLEYKKVAANTDSLKGLSMYITNPLRNLFGSAFAKDNLPTMKAGDLVDSAFYKKTYKDFTDLPAATIKDSNWYTKKLSNVWSIRSGFCGIFSMSFAALLPECPQTDEETRQEIMHRDRNRMGYYATQAGRALWFLPETAIQFVRKAIHPNEDQHIGKHTHQFVGLGFIASGICSVLSGLRQVQGKTRGNQHYMFNPWQVGVGLFTSMAGWSLMNGVDNEQSWRNFGFGMILRNVTLPANIVTRFKESEQGAGWYFAGQSIFQSKNVFATLIGGAQKKNGKAIDLQEQSLDEIRRVKSELRQKHHIYDFDNENSDQAAHQDQNRDVAPDQAAAKPATTIISGSSHITHRQPDTQLQKA